MPASNPTFTNPVPHALAAVMEKHPGFAHRYLQVDPRSVGLVRYGLGILLFVELFAMASSQPIWLVLAFAVISFLLLAGFHTRLMQVLALLAVVSLGGASNVLHQFAKLSLPLLCLWTLFLPVQARFSIDALLDRLRSPKEVRPEPLAQRYLFAPPTAPAASLAVAAMILYLALLGGTAVRNRNLTFDAGAFAAVALLVLNPWAWRFSRTLAFVVALGAAVSINTWNLLVWSALFLPSTTWSWSARVFGPRHSRQRIVYIDAGCGVCFALARLLSRLDTFNLLTIVANDSPDRPANLPEQLVQDTIVVDDPVSQQRWLKADAFAQIFAALPGGAPIAWLLRMPFVRWLAMPAYDLFARNRARVSVALGMAACGLPSAPASAAPAPPPPPAGTWLLAAAREWAVVFVFAACVLLQAR